MMIPIWLIECRRGPMLPTNNYCERKLQHRSKVSSVFYILCMSKFRWVSTNESVLDILGMCHDWLPVLFGPITFFIIICLQQTFWCWCRKTWQQKHDYQVLALLHSVSSQAVPQFWWLQSAEIEVSDEPTKDHF